MNLARLGLFGGAFDPPHRAHVLLAEAALQQLALDELKICPTGQAWHKARALTAARDRLAMARLAFGALPRAVIDEREIQRSGPTYTIDTLRELKTEHPAADLFLVMGEDQAASFETWREWREIARLATLAVAQRQYASERQPPLVLPEGVRAVRIALPILPESATEVRRRLTAGQEIAELVPAPVAGYIEQHHLYQTSR